MDSIPHGHKKCPGCKEIKPLTEEYFLPNHKQTGKFYPPCRICAKQRRKDHYWTHREQELQINHEYLQRTLEQRQQYWKENYQATIEVRRANARNYQKTHHDQRSATQRNRYAREKSIPGMHTEQQIQEQLKRQKHKCYYCSIKFRNLDGRYIYHVDHTFPVSRVAGTGIPANDISYLVLACHSCNESKKDKYPWEWPEGNRLL